MSTFLAALVVHSLLLTGLLLGHGRRSHRGNLALAGLVATVGLLLLESWFRSSGVELDHPHFLGAFQPIWYVVGPICYLYIRRFLGLGFVRYELLLAVPALVAFLLLIPFYLLSGAEKLAIATSGEGNPNVHAIALLSFTVLTLVCAIASARAISTVQQRDPESLEPTWHSSWLRLLMWGMVGYAILDFLCSMSLIFFGEFPEFASWLSFFFLVSLVYATGYLVILPEGLLARAAAIVPVPGKAGGSPLASERAEFLAKELEALMVRERPWLQDTFRQDDLAQSLGVSRHHLSQVLNHHLDQTFNDYINQFRVEEAKRLLLEEGGAGNTLTVGMAAGFGSASSFYRAFRKSTGMTPKKFLAKARFSLPDSVEGISRNGANRVS